MRSSGSTLVEVGPAAAIETIKKRKYTVVRIPNSPLDPKTYITYTNAIFETRGGQRIVYLPQYGILPLDAAAARIYESRVDRFADSGQSGLSVSWHHRLPREHRRASAMSAMRPRRHLAPRG